MSAVVSILDDNLGAGAAEFVRELEFPSESITVRELIRERVYQEVDDFNRILREQAKEPAPRMLVAPTETERRLNDHSDGQSVEVDWKRQFEIATDAYERRQILVLVGDRQTESLDETVELTRGVDVIFLRLMLLVGG